MGEHLAISDRIDLALRSGESEYREFKSAMAGPAGSKRPRPAPDIAIDIARTLVAFANADGGELLVGVEDDSTVTGLMGDEEYFQVLLGSYRTHVHVDTPLPTPLVAKVEHSNKIVLFFSIQKGTEYIYLTSDGRCIRRNDRESLPVSTEAIKAERIEKESRDWDRQFVDSATLADINIDIVEEVASQVAYGISAEKCLQYLRLAEFARGGLRLTNAAVALFAKDISKWMPRCQVRIMTVKGTERRAGSKYNIVKDDIVQENIFTLVDRAWERMLVAISEQTQLTETAKFKQSFSYPQIACREALVNAIVHRNYAIEGRGIEVSILADRMEIVSPGALLATVPIGELRKASGIHESRNPLIARVLREVGVVREMGEGIRRIFMVMQSKSLQKPELESSSTSFTVTLKNKSMYSKEVLLWLEEFDKYGLSDDERSVLSLGYGGSNFSTQDIMDKIGTNDVDLVRELVTPLRNQGLVQRTLDKNKLSQIARKEKKPRREVAAYCVPLVGKVERKKIESENAGDGESNSNDQCLRLFVSNIDYRVSRSELVGIIEPIASVLACEMPRPRIGHGKHRGFAFVEVERPADPNWQLSHLDGLQVGTRKISVRYQK